MRKLTPRVAHRQARREGTNDLGLVLELDQQVTSRVRVRAWLHRGGKSSWPACAHDAVEIAWVENGGILYKIGTKDLVVGTGCAIVVPAGIEHASTIVEGTKAKSLWIGREMFREIAEVIRCAHGADPSLLAKADRLSVLGQLLALEAEEDKEGKILAVEALAEAVVVEALRSSVSKERRKSPQDPRILNAVSMIETCYADPLTVDELAAAAGLSRFHFSRLFREQLGMSPYRYLVCQRLEGAASLLRRGGRSVTEVAFSVGFQDLGRFSRLFRERFGCSPSEVLMRRTMHLLP